MFAWDIGYWYCCLPVREAAVLRATIIGLADTLYIGIPKELWDIFWLPYGVPPAAVVEAFLSIYKLEIVTIVVDEADLDVIRARSGSEVTYMSWALYLLSPGAACFGGCQQSTVP